MNKRQAFLEQFPTAFFADAADLGALTNYLSTQNFLQEGETIQEVSVPGAGNMNYVIRVRTNQRSFILKQSRPWVEKYPSIPASIDRIKVEVAYYQLINSSPTLAAASPAVLLNDPDNYVMILEDLGALEDLSYLYQRGKTISTAEITTFASYLARLHQLSVSDFDKNREMRSLNYDHVFTIPFAKNNGLDLNGIQEGLADLTALLQENEVIAEIAKNQGEIYWNGDEGTALLHGDFYPGSLMNAGEKMYVLDPEFCFVGQAEFDIGVFVGHLYLAQQSPDKTDLFLETYQKQTDATFDRQLVYTLAGIEIIRRIMGVAQLPLPLTVAEKRDLVELGIQWMLVDKV